MGRGAKPGERRGGRAKGTPNKKTAQVKERLESLGVDPIEGLAKLGKQAEKDGDKNLAATCYKVLAEYCEPKRRAIEYTEQREAMDPAEVEQAWTDAIREEISKLSAKELAESISPQTLKQLKGDNVTDLKEAG